MRYVARLEECSLHTQIHVLYIAGKDIFACIM